MSMMCILNAEKCNNSIAITSRDSTLETNVQLQEKNNFLKIPISCDLGWARQSPGINPPILWEF